MTTTAEITTLPTPSSTGYPELTGINSSGTVIGVTSGANNSWEGFEVSNGVVTILAPTPSYASGINSSGEIVGWSGSSYAASSWLYGGSPTNLLPSGGDGEGNAVNSTGSVGGYGWYNGESFVAFVSINGTLTWLGTLNNLTPTGNRSSMVKGLNDSNEAVGSSIYQSGSTNTHAFSWANGVMTDLGTLSGGDHSAAVAINNAGLIVGNSNATDGNIHAVFWQNGAISDLGELAGGSNSQANAVNNKGQIVGFSSIPSGGNVSTHAVLWQNGVVTDLNSLLPANSGWVLDNATAITDTGLIIGSGIYKSVETPFEMSLNGLTTPLHTAEAVVSLFDDGLSSIPLQTVSDSAADVSANLDALQAMVTAGDLASIALTDTTTPIVTLSAAQLIKDAGVLTKISGSFALEVVITGAYASDINITLTAPAGTNMTVSFNGPYSHYSLSASANNSSVSVTDTLAGEATNDVFNGVTSVLFDDGTRVFLDSHGLTAIQAVGATTQTPQSGLSIDAQGNIAGFAGSNQTPAQEVGFLWSGGSLYTLAPLAGAAGSAAYHVDNGEIVGQSYATNSAGGSSTAAVWYASSVERGSATPTSLGWLPGDFASIAYSNNDNGAVIGVSYTTGTTYHGFLWQNGSMISLGSLGGSQIQPVAINDATEIVGEATTVSGATHAFLWQNGSMTDLGVLAGGTSSTADGINAGGVTVGRSSDSTGLEQAVEWKGGQIERLCNLLTNTSGGANGINDQGFMVGWSGYSASSIPTAVLWANGGIYNLNAFLPSNSGWTLADAYSINDSGQISGWGYYNGAVTNFKITLPAAVNFTVSNVTSEFSNNLIYGTANVADSAAHVAAGLDGLESIAAVGDLGSISLTDSGTPTLTLGVSQLASDASALNDISGGYNLILLAGPASMAIAGPAGHATTVSFTGAASQYDVTSANGAITVSGNGVTDQITNAAAIQFSDFTEIVAAPPGTANVTTGNVTELYSAVLGREPDVGGLTFYQNYLRSNPGTPLIQFAEWFLTSSEYSSGHHYAQTPAGETQFITDSYQNLLHRAPSASDISFYLTNVLEQPGGQLANHAQMLVYFSASPEFLSDVQITAANPVNSQHWLILA